MPTLERRAMQNRKTKKIIVDAVKLETLLRLGCPPDIIFEKISKDIVSTTQDYLINTLLESLTDVREYQNWGGNRNPIGKNQYSKNKKLGQVDHQVDGQDVRGQDTAQVVDKDKDKDIVKDIDNIKFKLKNILSKYHNREFNTKSWGEPIRKLINLDKVPAESISLALDWYAEHIGGEYIPVIESGTSLREKYSKLQNAIKREAIDKKYCQKYDDDEIPF